MVRKLGNATDSRVSTLEKISYLPVIRAGVSLLALVSAAGVASAQSAPSDPQPAASDSSQATPTTVLAQAASSTTATVNAADIVVTGSRVVRNGFSAPTPVTVVGADQIAASAQPNIFNVVNQLPALAGSLSPQVGNGGSSGGTGGLSSLGLRGLGTNRTLVLLDGQRVVGAALTGIVDVSELPQTLISRVDIVTGGASADWGSDAVAGVINFITDTKFVGVKGEVSAGVTTYGDDDQHRFSLTAGTSLFGDRGHLVLTGEYAHQDGIAGIPRPWYRGTKVLQQSIAATPAGTPQYLVRDRVADIQIAPGGVITAGPLRGTAFGAGGVPYAFVYGNPIVSPLMVGGQQSSDIGNVSDIDDRLTRKTLYGRFTFDLTPDISVWASGIYGRVHTHYTSGPLYKTANLTIQRDNAFLPASIVAAMVAANVTSFQFGTWNQDVGPFEVDNTRTMKRGTVGVDGHSNILGTDWKWNGYYEYGQNHIINRNPNESITPLYNLAIDAVRAPSGAIVCRSTLTNPTNGCVPLNIIGTGVASAAGIAYMIGEPYLLTTQKQQAAALSFSGEPFAIRAGPVSIAAGAEYRRESFVSRGDPISEGNAGNPALSPNGNNFFTGNFHGSRGAFRVIEGFVETVVPLLDSERLGKAEFNGAARATDYSTAGYVTTWKLGMSYSPIPDIRFRGTLSRDVRAPNLQELFQAAQVFTQTVIDDFPPFAGQTFTIQRPQVGNPDLKSEIATSLEAGVVLQPRFVDGLRVSFDFYRIRINNVVSTLTNQQTMDLCFQGNQLLCNQIVRNAIGQPISLTVQAINLARQSTRGFDIEAAYALPLNTLSDSLGGRFDFRVLATHIISNLTETGIPNAPPQEIAGQNSGSSPHWRILATQTYRTDDGALTASFTHRWISAGVINNLWVECTSNCPLPTINNPTVDNNRIAGAYYLDVGASYKFKRSTGKGGIELYGKIDNAFNKYPPRAAGNGSLALISSGVNPTIYDTIGRVYRAGVRFSY